MTRLRGMSSIRSGYVVQPHSCTNGIGEEQSGALRVSRGHWGRRSRNARSHRAVAAPPLAPGPTCSQACHRVRYPTVTRWRRGEQYLLGEGGLQSDELAHHLTHGFPPCDHVPWRCYKTCLWLVERQGGFQIACADGLAQQAVCVFRRACRHRILSHAEMTCLLPESKTVGVSYAVRERPANSPRGVAMQYRRMIARQEVVRRHDAYPFDRSRVCGRLAWRADVLEWL